MFTVYDNNWMALMDAIFSWSFWFTETQTVLTTATGLLRRTFTMGPLIMRNCSPPPPVPARLNCKSATASGIFSIKCRSMPIFIVLIRPGHDPHAPCSFSFTTFRAIS